MPTRRFVCRVLEKHHQTLKGTATLQQRASRSPAKTPTRSRRDRGEGIRFLRNSVAQRCRPRRGCPPTSLLPKASARSRRPALPHLHHVPPRLSAPTTPQPLLPGPSAQRHHGKRRGEGGNWNGGSWGGAAPCRGQPDLPATWPREQPNRTGPGRGAGMAERSGPGEEQSGPAGRAERVMAAGGAQTARPQHPSDQTADRPTARLGAHLQVTCAAGSAIVARAPRFGSGGSGVTALAVGNEPEDSNTFSRRLNLKWTAAVRQSRGAGGEGRRGRESVPVPVWPRLWLRGCSRNGARPLAAPRTARGCPVHRAGALAR